MLELTTTKREDRREVEINVTGAHPITWTYYRQGERTMLPTQLKIWFTRDRPDAEWRVMWSVTGHRLLKSGQWSPHKAAHIWNRELAEQGRIPGWMFDQVAAHHPDPHATSGPLQRGDLVTDNEGEPHIIARLDTAAVELFPGDELPARTPGLRGRWVDPSTLTLRTPADR